MDALAVASVISLICLPHLVYDYCFLLPVLVSAQLRKGWVRWALQVFVLVPWFSWLVGVEVLDPRHVVNQLGTLLLLLGCLTILTRTAVVGRARAVEDASEGESSASIQRAPEPASTGHDGRTSRE